MVALSGLLFFSFILIVGCIKLGRFKGLFFLSILSPIGLHLFVELPFYLSSVHWFYCIFICYVFFYDDSKVFCISLSKGMTLFSCAFSIIVYVVAISFFVHTLYSIFSIKRYVDSKFNDISILSPARNNIYTVNYADYLVMVSLFYTDLARGENHRTDLFIGWAIDRIEKEPNIELYIDLVEAYSYIGDKDIARHFMDEALYYFPSQVALLNTEVKIFGD
ncbi:hypothetical protein GCM10026986_04390 [Nitrincola alkalisediminis]